MSRFPRPDIKRVLVFSLPILACAAGALATADDQHVLRNAHQRVVVDLRKGSISEWYDLDRPFSPLIFAIGDLQLQIASGDYGPASFSLLYGDSTSAVLESPGLQLGGELLPLHATIQYRLSGRRLKISYSFEALERLELDSGLYVNLSSSSWDSLLIRNHFSGEAPVAFAHTDTVRHFALNQVYELRNDRRRLTMVIPNPYHGLARVSTTPPYRFLFRWYVLVGTNPFGAADIYGHPLTSVLVPGVELRRQIELIVSHEDDESAAVTSPIAYFSPFPEGYDQVIAMTFDDIPFWCWTFPKSSDDPGAQYQKYLIRLLEDHPKMKMGWIILPDKILHEYQLATPEYPAGKWWRAHGRFRILTEAPENYRQWIRNIDRDSLVYGYEDRVHLGSHGYHHTPEMEFGSNWEFQYYDPEFNDSTFHMIVEEYRLLGLSEKSHKWIRFPGFHFTDATIKTLIKYGFVFFDYWGVFDKLPWMLFYSEHGRIWGAGTWWSGDIPLSYKDMDLILRDGKFCHTCGHPGSWFDGYAEAAYAEIHAIFEQAEVNYPNLGYMFPDDVGYFADETYDIRGIDTGFSRDNFAIFFNGSARRSQTIVIERPRGSLSAEIAIVDDQVIRSVESRGRRFLVTLPLLASGPHVVRVLFAPSYTSTAVTPPATIILYQNSPNPFNASTTIRYYVPDECAATLEIFDSAGELISRLLDRQRTQEGFHVTEWLGVDDAGRAVSSGVYFCRLTACMEVKSRKMILVR